MMRRLESPGYGGQPVGLSPVTEWSARYDGQRGNNNDQLRQPETSTSTFYARYLERHNQLWTRIHSVREWQSQLSTSSPSGKSANPKADSKCDQRTQTHCKLPCRG